MAARMTLYVVSAGGGWAVRWEGANSVVSSHYTQAEAIRNAGAIVGSLPPGYCSQILVQGVGGQFRTEWTYGRDFFPPLG